MPVQLAYIVDEITNVEDNVYTLPTAHTKMRQEQKHC